MLPNRADHPVNPPIIESVMIYTRGTYHSTFLFSFYCTRLDPTPQSVTVSAKCLSQVEDRLAD